ncbi:hypothetical protein [Parapedobacter sp.]
MVSFEFSLIWFSKYAATLGKGWTRVVIMIITFLSMINTGISQELPKIGQIWRGEKTGRKIYLPPPADFADEVAFSIEGVVFRGGVSDDNEIISVSTVDSTFEINGKTYINNQLGDFRNKDEIKLVPGWGHYLPLDDGWYACFHYHRPIADSSKVLFVFKYKFSY